MNRKHKRRLVKAIYKVNDFPALDEYGSRIFGRPVRGTWKMFRHITRMAAADVWGWSNKRELASYPGRVEVPTFDEFATFMLHEVAHGWCYFLKDGSLFWDYPKGFNEERVCYDVSKLVCEMLGISYQEELADLCYRSYLLTWTDDMEELERLAQKMPSHLQL